MRDLSVGTEDSRSGRAAPVRIRTKDIAARYCPRYIRRSTKVLKNVPKGVNGYRFCRRAHLRAARP